MEASSRFLNEQDRGRGLGTAGSNKALNKILIKVSAEFLYLITAYTVQSRARRKGPFFKINSVVIGAVLRQGIGLLLEEYV